MAEVKVTGRCPKHDRYMFNGSCLKCREESRAIALHEITTVMQPKARGFGGLEI